MNVESFYKPFALAVYLFFLSVLNGCGGGASSSPTATTQPTQQENFSYKGLTFYHQALPKSAYKLEPLSDETFAALPIQKRLTVADKLYGTLFYAKPLPQLKEAVASDTFLSDTFKKLFEHTQEIASIENTLIDSALFARNEWNEQEAVDILARFYLMKDLDRYYLDNWIAYILTQTVMFSPAYEVETSHDPNIARVYNRLVTMMQTDAGMRYITYVHMMSEDNWRRFRSPEDNGREMLEIFTYDFNDTHVPIAAKALQNWKLDKDNDTLVVSLNRNTQPLELFGTTVVNGDDFYRELVKSDLFVQGVTRRLVAFFFPDFTDTQQQSIVNAIIRSRPETWHDIILQIVFSKQYLLENTRAKSAEESVFALMKKLEFRHKKDTFHYFKRSLEAMHQASMKYKLGKTVRVPLDTLSFAQYHRYLREHILLRISNPQKADQYDAWDRQGWSVSILDEDRFDFDENDPIRSASALIASLFEAVILRQPDQKEYDTLLKHIKNNAQTDPRELRYSFDLCFKHEDADTQKERRLNARKNIARVVFEYLSRLEENYLYKRIQ